MKKELTKRQETYMIKKYNNLMLLIGRDEEMVERIDGMYWLYYNPANECDYNIADMIAVCKVCIGLYFEDGHAWNDDYKYYNQDGHVTREINALRKFISKYRPYAVGFKAEQQH